MTSQWRLKFYLFLFLVGLSVYVLTPTLLNIPEIRENAQKTGEDPPWYVKLFPNQQINLGLDLRGGIYLELEVDLQDALIHRSEIIASELERFLKEKNIPYQSVRVLPKTSNVAIWLNNQDDRVKVENHLRDIYGNTLSEIETPPVLLYQIEAVSEDDAQQQFQKTAEWAKLQKGILDVQKNQMKLEVVLQKDASPQGVSSAVSAQFGEALKPAQPPVAVYLAQSETYQERLKDETLKQAVETIRNRIDRHGVAEPTIQRLGENRVVVELPGVKDPDRAIGLVKRAGKLEFKLVDEEVPDARVQELVETARKDTKMPSGFTEDVVLALNESLKGKIPAESEIAFEVQYDPVTKKQVGGVPYLLKRKVEVSGEMLSNAQVSVQNNEPYVSLSFDTIGTKAFADLTANNVNKRLAIMLDGVVSKAPVIKSAIPSGEAQITLGYGDYQALIREAEDLVVVLREGALPASLNEATKTIIGPSLGKSTLDRAFKAMLLSASLVMLFMGIRYKWSGVLADLALAFNVLFIFGALSLFGATLTLPGIAGIVLTIGMAVDANIIIFERIKEELLSGKSLKSAVDAGYANAGRAVLDSNLTVFFSGVVLYQFGTGPVRGFAVTLMIGILTTLFTAVIFTRLVYDFFLTRKRIERLSL